MENFIFDLQFLYINQFHVNSLFVSMFPSIPQHLFLYPPENITKILDFRGIESDFADVWKPQNKWEYRNKVS